REHRWIRGDWQLLPWLIACLHPGQASAPKRLPAIGFWKIADNLRRTLTAPAILVSLLVSWTLPLHLAAIWDVFLLVTISWPTLMPVLAAILPSRFNITLSSHLDALGTDLYLGLLRIGLRVACLTHQVSLTVDAIVRTFYRLYISRQNLLEWTTAAQ